MASERGYIFGSEGNLQSKSSRILGKVTSSRKRRNISIAGRRTTFLCMYGVWS